MHITVNSRTARLSGAVAAMLIAASGTAFAQGTVPTFGTIAAPTVSTSYGQPIGTESLTTISNVGVTTAPLTNVQPYCGPGFTVSPAGNVCVPSAPEPVLVQSPQPVAYNPPPVIATAPPPPPPVAPVPYLGAAGLSNAQLAAAGIGAAVLVGVVAIALSDDDDSTSTTTTTN